MAGTDHTGPNSLGVHGGGEEIHPQAATAAAAAIRGRLGLKSVPPLAGSPPLRNGYAVANSQKMLRISRRVGYLCDWLSSDDDRAFVRDR